MSIINGSVDLLKVPTAKVVEKDGKEFIVIDITDNSKLNHFKRESNEKPNSVYMGIATCQKREVDDYGKTHYIELNRTKEEREQGADRVYLGDGKEFVFDNNSTSANNAQVQNNNTPSGDDLPF